MAYCGVKPACGFNKKGQRVRACRKHRYLKTTALGKKLVKGEPQRPYVDQSKYHDKYRQLPYIKKKAARGSKAAQEALKRIMDKKGKGKKAVARPKLKAKAKAPKKAANLNEAIKEQSEIQKAKALKAARDKRYRESKKAKKKEVAATTMPAPMPDITDIPVA